MGDHVPSGQCAGERGLHRVIGLVLIGAHRHQVPDQARPLGLVHVLEIVQRHHLRLSSRRVRPGALPDPEAGGAHRALPYKVTEPGVPGPRTPPTPWPRCPSRPKSRPRRASTKTPASTRPHAGTGRTAWPRTAASPATRPPGTPGRLAPTPAGLPAPGRSAARPTPAPGPD